MGAVQKYLIIKDRIDIYKDFTLNLLYYIHRYYIDYESLCKDSDIKNHYNWCYNKVCDEFLLEGIDFKDNSDLNEYFYLYYYTQFYRAQENQTEEMTLEYFEQFWENIFDITLLKNKNLNSLLIELYIIFDKSVMKQKIQKKI